MHSDFSSFQTRFACIRGLPSLLVLKGKWFTFPRESCLVQSLVATLQLFFGFFVDNSLISCRWICYPRTSGLQNFSGKREKHVGGVDFFTRQSDTSTQVRLSSYRVPFPSHALRFVMVILRHSLFLRMMCTGSTYNVCPVTIPEIFA